MESMLMSSALGQAGAYAAVAFAAIGSGFGAGAACTAAVEAWKKCYAVGRPAPLQLAIFAGAPLTQTIYGMILMFLVNAKLKDEALSGCWPLFLMIGVAGGIAMGVSAWKQGEAAAGSCHAFCETGKGFTNYLMGLGIIETVAIFTMAFAIILLGLLKGGAEPVGLAYALGQAGAYAAVAFAAIGSGLGAGAACAAAVEAWKKCYATGRPAPLQLAIFAGAPLTQTIYGMILMFLIGAKLKDPAMAGYWPLFLMIGVAGGVAMGVSAWKQGVAAAGSCHAFGETGKGFTNYLMSLGIIETVAIFTMAFAIILLGLIK